MENDNFVSKKASEVLNLFGPEYKEARGARGGYFVSCPFHGRDSDPSLHIYDSDSRGQHKLMVKCFGCDIPAREILNFINTGGATQLSASELAALTTGKRTAKKMEDVELTLTNTYSYKDPTGGLLYQVMRFEPKTFRYRRPTTPEEYESSGKKWAYTVAGFDPTLYNLDLIQAVKDKSPTTWVFKVEGEGKADLLRTHKIVATCNTFGATTGKWKPEYAELLKGLNVVIIPDNDLTGYNHMYEVSENLLPVVNSLKIIILPRLQKLHDDVKDWFNKYGGTKEELLLLLDSATELKNSSIEYIKENYPYTFIDSEVVSIDLSSLNDLIGVDPQVEETAQLYSEKLQNFLQRGREILEEEGSAVGLCSICLNTGFVLSRNEDNMLAIEAQVSMDAESGEDGNSVILTQCSHGNFDQDVSDFGF